MHVEDLKILFGKRGYADYLIKKQVEKALRLTPGDEDNSNNLNGISLVVTYNRTLKNLSQMISKNLQLTFAGEQVKN